MLHQPSRTNSGKRLRRGIALIMVMILIVMISLGAYSFTQVMTAQETSAVITGRRTQAEAAVASGVEYIKDYLTLTADDQLSLGGHFNNVDYFKDVLVGGPDNLRFSVLSIMEDQYGEPSEIRFGLTDQNSKLNVNFLASDAYNITVSEDGQVTSLGGDEGGQPQESLAPEDDESSEDAEAMEDLAPVSTAARDALMQLPNMTEAIADSILDWIDADDTPRDFGAELAEYGALGYQPRNGPISSLDELLLVQGVTNELLYGADRNHNGLIDAEEQGSAAGIAASGSLARGWSAFLTVNSADRAVEVDETITPVDINQDDLEALYDELVAASFEDEFARYVVVYRQSGPYVEEIPDPLPDDYEPVVPEPIGNRTPDFSKSGETKIECVLDLLGGASQGSFPVEGEDQPETAVCSAPYSDDADLSQLLPQMMLLLDTGQETAGSEGVNTNLANASVLAGLPGLDDETVQSILQAQDREGISGDPNYEYSTWPLGLGAVTIEQMKQLKPFVSGTGSIYRAQIVGYSDVPGVYARAEVIIDASGDAPLVLSWRDLSHLGLGFSLETLSQ